MRAVLSLLLLVVALVAADHELNYRVGQTVVYDMNSHVQHSAQGSKNTELQGGSKQEMRGTSVAKCIQINADESMVFAYNMFDVNVTSNDPTPDDDGDDTTTSTLLTSGLTTHLSSHLSALSGDLHEPAGADAYYVQARDGSISRVWFAANNEDQVNSLLLGGINAMHLHMAQDKPSRPLTTDVTGEHYVSVDAAHNEKDVLKMNSGFVREDYVQFTDAALDTSSVQLTHTTTATVAPTRHISGVSQKQTFVLMAGNEATEVVAQMGEQDDAGDADVSGFDSVITSAGAHHFAENEELSARAAALEASHPAHLLLSTEDLDAVEGLIGGSLLEHGTYHTELVNTAVPEIDLAEEVAVLIADSTTRGDRVATMDVLAQWVRLTLAGTQQFVDAVEEVSGSDVGTLSHDAMDGVFYVLAVSGTTPAQNAIIKFGLTSADEGVRVMATLATQNIVAPTPALVAALRSVAAPVVDGASSSPAAGMAALALGTAAGRATADVRDFTLGELAGALNRHVSLGSKSRATVLISALSNADAVTTVHEESLAALFAAAASDNEDIARAATSVIVEDAGDDEELRAAVSALGSYPKQWSWSKSLNLGGGKVSLNNSLTLFLGANLDCKHTSFRYKALARALSVAQAFGFGKTVLKAEFEYAHSGETLVADHVLLEVWGRKIYDYHLGDYGSCSSKDKTLFNTGKGFDVGFTYYVVVIPVRFYVGASFSVSAKYGWTVCPANLQASVYVQPAGTLSVYGGASASIWVARAGIQATVSLGTSFRPEGIVDGNQCHVEFKVRRIAQPMSASIAGWWQHKSFHCHHWHCHFRWSGKHSKTFWHWTRAAEDTTIYDKIWPLH